MAARLLAYASVTLSLLALTFSTEEGFYLSVAATVLAVLSAVSYFLSMPYGTHP